MPPTASDTAKNFLRTAPSFSFPHLSRVKTHNILGGIRKFYKKNTSDIQLVMLPLLLFLFFITLDAINNHLLRSISQQEFTYYTSATKINPYPFIKAAQSPEVTAKAAIIVDRDSQVIVFAKNPRLRFSMASTTKIMTALTGLDYYKLDDILTIKRGSVEGSGLGFVRGEQYTFESLLYAMLLPSANDAAQAIADNYPWGAGAFVDRMNRKAATLHLPQTHFSDPSGLDDDGDYTTVVDLARLASHAMSNPTLTRITSTKYKTIANTSGTRQFQMVNLNKLLGYQGVTGMKTGTTEGAGEVLVSTVEKDGHTYVIVVMQSTNRFADTSALIDYVNSSVLYVLPDEKKH